MDDGNAQEQLEALRKRHTVSIVVPVYQGERTLPALMAEIAPLTIETITPAGWPLIVTEVLLVHDHGPDDSASVIHSLAEQYDFIRPVWLSRNFGQHPATLAGMASSGGDWIVTLDEDGQHNPADIASMLDTAMAEGASVVYAKPTNAAPHGFLRNLASRTAKKMLSSSSDGPNRQDFQSFRLVLGEIGRSVAAYAGSGVYLDVAMGWVADKIVTSPVQLRAEGSPSGYSFRTLTSHFWRMVLSSGTKGLRLVSILGELFAVGGFVLALFVIISRLFSGVDIAAGWASQMVVTLLVGGAILFSLGIIAEYIGVAVNMAMGRPLYLIVSDPVDGPLGRRQHPAAQHPAAQHPAAQHPVANLKQAPPTAAPAGQPTRHP